jgi:hypothetical protein
MRTDTASSCCRWLYYNILYIRSSCMLLHVFVFACLEIKLRVGWNAALVMMWFQQN